MLLLLTGAAGGPDRFGESCTGSESVQVGQRIEKNVPFHIELSIDLRTNSYCYGACGKGQSYPIADLSSSRIKLADARVPNQMRRLTFDRATQHLTDEQRVELGPMGAVVRHAFATCRRAPFRTPAAP